MGHEVEMDQNVFQASIADLDIEALKAQNVKVRLFAGTDGASLWLTGLPSREDETVSIEFPKEAVDYARLAFRLITTALR